MKPSNSLSHKKITLFWLPLAATWLMMATEGPFLAAIIARMLNPKFNLAAYGVAFSLALIIEAPIIMLMSASVALVKDTASFFKLRAYTYTLNVIITIIMIGLLFPPVFFFIACEIIDLPMELARLTHVATALLLPWPCAIGYRRFYQGILIRNNLTRLVGYSTFIRMSTMAISAITIFHFLPSIPGAWAGTFALSAGVVIEAVSIRWMARNLIAHFFKHRDDTKPLITSEPPITYRKITHFYYPLALSSILGLSAQPMITFFVGQSRFPIESLAVLPVIGSLSFIFRSLGLSYQEVGVALLGETLAGYQKLKTFAIFLGLSLTAGLALIAFTPLSEIWFSSVSGLSNELMQFSLIPLMIVAVLPGFEVMISFQRSVLVNSRRTFPIIIATAIEVSVIICALLLLIHNYNMIGATAACTALLLGRIAAIAYISFPVHRAILRSVVKNETEQPSMSKDNTVMLQPG